MFKKCSGQLLYRIKGLGNKDFLAEFVTWFISALFFYLVNERVK